MRATIIEQIQERGVAKMAAWYVASAWLTIQVVQTVMQAFYLPPWLLTLTVVVAIGAFPIALFLAWHFDIKPDAHDIDETAARKSKVPIIAVAIIGLLTVFTAGFFVTPARYARKQAKILCAGGVPAPCRLETTMDAHRFVVLPLAHDQGVEPSLLNGEICARLIGDGLAQWQDMNMADPLRLAELLGHMSAQMRMNIPVDTGIAMAQELGAGKLIMGRLSEQGDSTRVEAMLYDVIEGRAINRASGMFPAGSQSAAAEFARLAKQLVVRDGDLSVSEPVAYSTTSYKALFAYDSAWKAISQWKLEDADRYLRTALFHDNSFAYANLWLAHVKLWRGDTTQAFVSAARAAGNATSLSDYDRALGRGISAMADKRYSDSCNEYSRAIRLDSANFHAWFGLGECLSKDATVVKDEKSPSGWSFASSYEQALRAHRRALQLVPAFNQAFANVGSSRMAATLFLFANAYRSGVSANGENFAAFPALQADTTAFIPYPLEVWSRQPRPSTQQKLLDYHRSVLRDVTETWAAAYPKNPRALESYATALEQAGLIDWGEGNSALSLMDEAHSLEKDKERLLRNDVARVRLLFKAGKFGQARRLAKRVLKTNELKDNADVTRLAGLAGLVGRKQQMAELLATTAADFDYDRPRRGEQVTVPADLGQVGARLLTVAYFGGPADSARALLKQAHAIVDRAADPNERVVLHEAMLDRPARMLFSVIGPEEVYMTNRALNGLMFVQRLQVRGDLKAAKDSLTALAGRQRALRPTEVASDGVYLQAQLWLGVNDTATAVDLLDRYLDDLPSIPASHFRQAYQPVTIVRMMALRAELAGKRRDAANARKWSRAVIDLWSEGDHSAETLRGMRQLAHLR